MSTIPEDQKVRIILKQNGVVLKDIGSVTFQNLFTSHPELWNTAVQVEIKQPNDVSVPVGDYTVNKPVIPTCTDPNAHYDTGVGQCVCNAGYELVNGVCTPIVIKPGWTSSKWTKVEELPKDQPNKNWIVGGSPSGWISTFDNQTVLSHAGTAGPAKFAGTGYCNLKGDQSRLYILCKNYNAVLTITLKPAFAGSSDDLSLKLRSRHNNGGVPENRFGGYGFAIGPSSWDAKREDYHNVHTPLASGSLSKKLVNGNLYKIKFTVQDDGTKVKQRAEIDYGQGFELIKEWFDNSPKSYMLNKTLYDTDSYFWIRNNGSGSINVRDVKLELL